MFFFIPLVVLSLQSLLMVWQPSSCPKPPSPLYKTFFARPNNISCSLYNVQYLSFLQNFLLLVLYRLPSPVLIFCVHNYPCFLCSSYSLIYPPLLDLQHHLLVLIWYTRSSLSQLPDHIWSSHIFQTVLSLFYLSYRLSCSSPSNEKWKISTHFFPLKGFCRDTIILSNINNVTIQ